MRTLTDEDLMVIMSVIENKLPESMTSLEKLQEFQEILFEAITEKHLSNVVDTTKN